MINKKVVRWVCLFVIVIPLSIFTWVVAEPYSHRRELVNQVAQITDSNIVNWKTQLSNSGNSSWMFKDYTSIYEKGILLLQDGTIVKFSFISHHLSKDHESRSYFKAQHFAKHVTGWFCCEVNFDRKEQPKDLVELEAILSKYDGVSP